MSEKLGQHDLLPEADLISLCNSPSKNHTFDRGSSQVPRDPAKTNFGEIGVPANTAEEGPKASNGSGAFLSLMGNQNHDLQSPN